MNNILKGNKDIILEDYDLANDLINYKMDYRAASGFVESAKQVKDCFNTY